MVSKTLNFLVEGGKANAGPPIGPALGPLGLAVMSVVNEINEKTKEFAGMRVPVSVTVDSETKDFTVQVGIPTTAALIIRELKVEKGSGKPGAEKAGDLSMEQVSKIAKAKMPSTLSLNLLSCAKEVLGSCVAMGVTVEGIDPRQAQKSLDEGKWRDLFK